MSLKFVNRICPNCKNPNYMILLENSSLEDSSKTYKYKCMNCNRYFYDIDFEKEPLQPVLKSECMNSKADIVEVVRCKDCKHLFDSEHTGNCCDVLMMKAGWLKEISVDPDWFCADGERRDDDGDREKVIELVKKAVECCKINKCSDCPFKNVPSKCMSVLMHTIDRSCVDGKSR